MTGDLFDGTNPGYEPTKAQLLANTIAIYLSFRYRLTGLEREAWQCVREIASDFDMLLADNDPEATSLRMKQLIENAFRKLVERKLLGQRSAAA